MNIDVYIEKAIKNSGAKSGNHLSKMLGLAPNAITRYRKNNVLPSDETMEKLAIMAGINKEHALLELNMWRSPEPVRKTYANILQKLAQATMAIVVLAAVPFSSTPALADITCKAQEEIIYIMGNKV